MLNLNYLSHLSKKRKQGQQAFTLIEVLLALLIFASLSMAGYQTLNQVQRSNQISLEKTQRIEDLQRALIIIDNDFRQIVSRKFSYNGSDKQLIFNGKGILDSQEQGLIFIRLGWTNPQNMFPRGEVLKVGYRLTEDSLERVWWYYPDTNTEQTELIRRLLTKVDNLTFRFYNGNQWQTEWTDQNKLPKGIEMTLSLEDYGDITRVYALPDEVKSDEKEVAQ